MEHVVFLSYKYDLLRDKQLEVGVYICQNEKQRKKGSAEVCTRGVENLPNGRSWCRFKAKPICVQNRKTQ